MGAPTTQLAIDFKGKRYSGIYSIAGNLMIARIPGISSRSAEVTDEEETTARALLTEILEQAATVGSI
jgi:hypothetical protein